MQTAVIFDAAAHRCQRYWFFRMSVHLSVHPSDQPLPSWLTDRLSNCLERLLDILLGFIEWEAYFWCLVSNYVPFCPPANWAGWRCRMGLSVCPFVCHTLAVSAHLWKYSGLIPNFMDTFMVSTGLIFIFRGILLFNHFPPICRQNADQIELRFGGPNHNGLHRPE